MPKNYINAVIAVEDHRYKQHGAIDPIAICRAFWTNLTHFELREGRFYKHGGVDIISIGRAVIKDIQAMSFVEGGSTITQQVAKNLFFITESDAATRKIAEIFAAIDLEKHYSKDTILELYVNTIYFGDGYYGIKEACKRILKYRA